MKEIDIDKCGLKVSTISYVIQWMYYIIWYVSEILSVYDILAKKKSNFVK